MAIAVPVLLVAGFLAASYVGAAIPRSVPGAARTATGEPAYTIQLITSPLHTDIALPVDGPGMEQFSVLAEDGFPIGHPNLHYIAFGWGAREFYTTAGTYADITLRAATRAVLGDSSVIRAVPLGDIAGIEGVIAYRLTARQFARLVGDISETFKGRFPQDRKRLIGASIGAGDLFYEANGHFNLLNPCNQWTGRLLAHAGIATGAWTPTTHSLMTSIAWHNGAGSNGTAGF